MRNAPRRGFLTTRGALLLTVAVLAGCGDEDAATTTPTTQTETTQGGPTDTETSESVSTSTDTAGTGTTGTETTDTDTTQTETETNGEPSTTNEVILGAVFSGFVDFGSVLVGGTVSKPIGVLNGTEETRTIVALGITGSSASDFKIVQDQCQGVTLAPQQRCPFNIDFTPSEDGIRRAALDVTVDPQPNSGVSLRGTGGLIIGPTPPPVTDPPVATG